MGGTGEFPNYGNYTQNNNYSETIRLLWDPSETNYSVMLDNYWQFAGPEAGYPSEDPAYQFRIFYRNDEQKRLATAALRQWTAAAAGQVYVSIYSADDYTFWKAEEQMQKYFWGGGGDACTSKHAGGGPPSAPRAASRPPAPPPQARARRRRV